MQSVFTARGRIWLGFLFWCTLAVTGFVLTFGFEGEIANYRYRADSWPRALFAAMIVFAAVQLVVSLRQPVSSAAREEDTGEGPVALGGLPLQAIVVPLLYIALLVPVGFFVATPPFLAGVMISMGERRPIYIILVTALIYALVVLIFVKLLYVPLPVGTWPGFYDFGNWLLVTVR